MDTGLIFPGAAANDATVGTIDWVDTSGTGKTLLQDISVIDGSSGICHPSGVRLSGPVTDTSAKLFIGGAASGTSQSLGTLFSTGERVYGGSTNLWGLTPTVSDVNASNFGFGISLTGNGGTSKYLYVSNFGFSIPTGATINGIDVTCGVLSPAGTPQFDYIEVRIYYTPIGFNIALV